MVSSIIFIAQALVDNRGNPHFLQCAYDAAFTITLFLYLSNKWVWRRLSTHVMGNSRLCCAQYTGSRQRKDRLRINVQAISKPRLWLLTF